jgi:hypothetical protein
LFAGGVTVAMCAGLRSDYQVDDAVGHDETHIWDYCFYSSADFGFIANTNTKTATFVCEFELPKKKA